MASTSTTKYGKGLVGSDKSGRPHHVRKARCCAGFLCLLASHTYAGRTAECRLVADCQWRRQMMGLVNESDRFSSLSLSQLLRSPCTAAHAAEGRLERVSGVEPSPTIAGLAS